MSGQTLTPGQVSSVLETTESQSLASIPVPTLARNDVVPYRKTLPNYQKVLLKD
jgi:hypothetical protein